jgi:TRAP transporter TAXI family solute receptor
VTVLQVSVALLARIISQRFVPNVIASAVSAARLAAGVGLVTFVSAGSAAAVSEFGTREEAVAMVHRAQEMFKKLGAEGTFQAVRRKAPGTIDRDLYVYILDMNGVVMANGAIPTMTPGTNLYNVRDQNGKYFVREKLELCKANRSGWVDFRFLNPKTQTIDDKSSYVERMGDYCVAVGIYRNEQVNENTVGIVSGSPSADDTYLQIANDLASVLNDSDRLRILPIVGVGGHQNIRDVRYLKGVDIGLTQLSVLNSYRSFNQLMGKNEEKIVLIAKLFNEEVHLIAGADISSIEQLKGRKVNIDDARSGTSQTMRDVFKRLGIKVEEVNVPQGQAFEMLKAGEIAATAYVSGKSAKLISNMRFERGIHFLPIPFSPTSEIGTEYLPSDLTHEDYPNLIPAGQTIQTIADEVVLIGFNWPKNSDRYRRVEKFIQAFFPRIEEFRKPQFHPKWLDVNLAVNIKGWKRFEPAEEWLKSNYSMYAEKAAQPDLSPVVSSSSAADGSTGRPSEKELFQEFLKWRQLQRPGR